MLLGFFYIFCMELELDAAGLLYIYIYIYIFCMVGWLWYVQCVSSARSRCIKEAPRAKGLGLIGFEDLGFRSCMVLRFRL